MKTNKTKKQRSLKQYMKGFTLIEVMVVVVILGILASIIVPKLMSRPDQAKIVKARQDVLAIESALELYKLDNGIYPSTDQSLNALVVRPSTEPAPSSWKNGGYLKRLRDDPWGHAYQYLNPGIHGEIDIFSFGVDGQPGGDGNNADIGNWDEGKQA